MRHHDNGISAIRHLKRFWSRSHHTIHRNFAKNFYGWVSTDVNSCDVLTLNRCVASCVEKFLIFDIWKVGICVSHENPNLMRFILLLTRKSHTRPRLNERRHFKMNTKASRSIIFIWSNRWASSTHQFIIFIHLIRRKLLSARAQYFPYMNKLIFDGCKCDWQATRKWASLAEAEKLIRRCDSSSHRECDVRPTPNDNVFATRFCVTYAFSKLVHFCQCSIGAPGTKGQTHGRKANSSRRSMLLRNRNANKTEMNKTNEWSKNRSSKSGNQKTLWI